MRATARPSPRMGTRHMRMGMYIGLKWWLGCICVLAVLCLWTDRSLCLLFVARLPVL